MTKQEMRRFATQLTKVQDFFDSDTISAQMVSGHELRQIITSAFTAGWNEGKKYERQRQRSKANLDLWEFR